MSYLDLSNVLRRMAVSKRFDYITQAGRRLRAYLLLRRVTGQLTRHAGRRADEQVPLVKVTSFNRAIPEVPRVKEEQLAGPLPAPGPGRAGPPGTGCHPARQRAPAAGGTPTR